VRATGSDRATALLACGAVGAPLFVVSFLLQGAARAGYSPMRHPVSSLALGPGGWVQAVTFVVTGLLMLAFAAGVRRALDRLEPSGGSRWGPVLLALYAVGLVGAGVFATDPVSGYPPGTPDGLAGYSATGALHDLFSLPVFAGLAAACLVFARWFRRRRVRGWPVASLATAVVLVAGYVLSGAGFAQSDGLVGVAGLVQRVTIATGWGWVAAFAVHLMRAVSRRGERRASPERV